MNIDIDKIDETVLALLRLGLHGKGRAWKSFDRDAMRRLHEKGFIFDPANKTQSVLLTEEGVREAERLFLKLFAR